LSRTGMRGYGKMIVSLRFSNKRSLRWSNQAKSRSGLKKLSSDPWLHLLLCGPSPRGWSSWTKSTRNWESKIWICNPARRSRSMSVKLRSWSIRSSCW